MTNQNNAAPLTGDEVRAAVRQARNMTAPSDTTQPGDYVMAGALALLSRLRAPVADTNDELRDALRAFTDFAAGRRAELGGLSPEMEAIDARARAALASAPVADERECGNGDCGWRGTTDRMRGSVGPLCPECGEITESISPVAGEAQPLSNVTCDKEVYARGASVGLFDIPKEQAQRLCEHLTAYTGHRYDWHYVAGRVHLKALAAPQASAEAEITSYVLVGETRVERVAQPDGTYLWAVRRNGNCLGLDGHWSYEPLPSSRTPEWLAFHRFPTAQAAIDASRWQEGEAC